MSGSRSGFVYTMLMVIYSQILFDFIIKINLEGDFKLKLLLDLLR